MKIRLSDADSFCRKIFGYISSYLIHHYSSISYFINKVEPNTIPAAKLPKKTTISSFEVAGVHTAALEGAVKLGTIFCYS